jgi:hypothetical protein
VLNVEANLAA